MSLTPAVLHCWTAYKQTYAIESGKGATHADAYEQGTTAYRDAIPCISDPESLREFITCVAHGMVLKVIPNEDGGKLLYAANVAAGMFRQPKAEASAQSHSSSKPDTQDTQAASKPATLMQPQAA